MKSIRAAGDAAVVFRTDAIVLATRRGVIARWARPPLRVTAPGVTRESFAERAVDAVVLEEPPRLAVFFRSGTLQKRITGNDIDYGSNAGGYGSGRPQAWTYDAEDDPANIPADDVTFEGGGACAFIDVATGAVEHELRLADLRAPLAFVPGGDRLVCATDASMALVDNRGAVADVKLPGPPPTRVVFAHGAAFALADAEPAPVESSSGEELRARISRIDGVAEAGERPALAWQRTFDRVREVAVGGDGASARERLVVIARDGGVDTVVVLDARTGETVQTVVRGADKQAIFRSLRVSPALERIVVVDERDALHIGLAHESEKDQWPLRHPGRTTSSVTVDAAAGVFVVPGRMDPPVPLTQEVRSLDDANAVIGTIDAAAWCCFACAPSLRSTPHAVFLKDGAVHVVDASSPHGRIVEGPADLVALATHPRGVIAVDREGCSEVVEL